jgi:hypothetical protein
MQGNSTLTRQKNMRSDMDVRADRYLFAGAYHTVWVNPNVASKTHLLNANQNHGFMDEDVVADLREVETH